MASVPEYIGKFGYDTKAAMHVIRLLNEGIEFVNSGTITLPRPERDLLISIRTGEYGSLEKITDLANRLFSQLESAMENSAFPDDADRDAINKLIARVYLDFTELFELLEVIVFDLDFAPALPSLSGSNLIVLRLLRASVVNLNSPVTIEEQLLHP